MSSLFYYRLDKLFKVLRLLRFVECADKVRGSKVRASAFYRLSILAMLYELCIAPPFLIPHCFAPLVEKPLPQEGAGGRSLAGG